MHGSGLQYIIKMVSQSCYGVTKLANRNEKMTILFSLYYCEYMDWQQNKPLL